MQGCRRQRNEEKTALPVGNGGLLLHCSKPVSRVLSFKTAIYLDALLPIRSSRLPGTAGPAYMSLHGVAPDRVYSDGRLTRHRVSSYLAFPPLPRICLSGRCGAVYFCCTFPRVAPGGCYPLSLPCGARTFLTGGPFAPSARLSSLLPDYHTGKNEMCQMAGRKIFVFGLSIISKYVRIS